AAHPQMLDPMQCVFACVACKAGNTCGAGPRDIPGQPVLMVKQGEEGAPGKPDCSENPECKQGQEIKDKKIKGKMGGAGKTGNDGTRGEKGPVGTKEPTFEIDHWERLAI
ncbi:hypothetical protein TELCIR_13506, partial [Teladorsagia circumcincta]